MPECVGSRRQVGEEKHSINWEEWIKDSALSKPLEKEDMFQKDRMRNHGQCCSCPNELTTAGNGYLRMVLKTIYYDGRDVLGVVRRHEWCLLTLKLQKLCT